MPEKIDETWRQIQLVVPELRARGLDHAADLLLRISFVACTRCEFKTPLYHEDGNKILRQHREYCVADK